MDWYTTELLACLHWSLHRSSVRLRIPQDLVGCWRLFDRIWHDNAQPMHKVLPDNACAGFLRWTWYWHYLPSGFGYHRSIIHDQTADCNGDGGLWHKHW